MGVQINGDTGNVSATKGDYSGNLTIGGVLTYEDVTNVDSVGIVTARQGVRVNSGGIKVTSGVSYFNANIVGTATTAISITATDESSDTTCNVLFATAATGNLAPKTGTNLTFNSSNGTLTATTFSGSGASLTSLPAANLSGTAAAINGSNITNLNGSAIASGTVPVARIGTGTKSTSTFYRGDGTFATVTPPAITTINSASNNRLVTSDGGTTVTAESNLNWNGSSLIIGGTHSNNSYNSVSSTRLGFGGGNDINDYFIGTNLEDYGGNYTKLDLRWHTGIRMGAQQAYGGIRFYDNEDLGAVKFSIMGGADAVTCHTTFRPAASNTYNLGNSSYRWGTLYASNATNTSDRNEKNTITESDLGLDFICKLKPVSYKWNQLVDREGEHLDTKTHYGLISQDVEETVIATGKTLDDFGAIDKPEGDDPMGLSYHEFISPLIKAIQEQQEQIKILQEKIAALEGS